jgi:pyridoxamine 5'-phosphate oxidase
LRAIFASRNPHKLEQVALLLEGVDLVPVDDVAPDLVLEEPYDTFEANALAKAHAVVRATGLPAIADDSGIEVDALGGAPGVLSARFAGEGASDEDNNRKLVTALSGVPYEQRTCRYRCVAVLVLPDGHEVLADGACEGHVVFEGRGTLGFGYDPHVVPDGETRTMGEIPLNEKLRFSHRGRAFRALAEKMAVIETSLAAETLLVERTRSALDETELDPDPFRQFDAWMRAALDRESPEPNAMTLATVSSDGIVSARTVLLRGFDHNGFVFYTNYDSRKARSIDDNPRVALVLYWGTLQRQVCITGRAEKVSAEESDAYFAARPRGHRLASWASAQSSVIDGRADLERRVAELDATYPDDVPRPPFWGGYRVVPDTIEFWQGRVNRLHDRLRYRRADDGSWVIERLAP